jgi:mRNA degradation ribonuclease J1/J2
VEDRVERALSSFFYQETKRRPVVTVAMMEV